MSRQALQFLAAYLVLATLAEAALVIDTWPRYPRSWLQSGLLLVIALPVAALGDWLTDRALSGAISLALEGRTRGGRIPWGRIAYYLALYVLFAVCAVAVLYWLQSPRV